jgi:hypothetical protein
MSKDLSKIFEKLLTRYISTIEKKYKERYKNSKDKELTVAELKKETGSIIGITNSDAEKSKLIDVFNHLYNRGDNINDIFLCLRNIFSLHETSFLSKEITRTWSEQIPVFIGEEEKALKYLPLEEKKLMQFIIRDMAYRKVHKYLDNMFLVNYETETNSQKI